MTKELKFGEWVKTRKCWKCDKYEEKKHPRTKEDGIYCHGKRHYLKKLLHDDDQCKHFGELKEDESN